MYPNEKEWEAVINRFVRLYRIYGLNDASDEEYYRGKVAMRIGYPVGLQDLYNTNNQDATYKEFNFVFIQIIQR